MSGSEDEPAPGEPGEPGRHGLPELIAERRAKGARLRESDPESFPYAFRDTEPIAGILGAYEHLSAGEETEDVHRVAGRLSARRNSRRTSNASRRGPSSTIAAGVSTIDAVATKATVATPA